MDLDSRIGLTRLRLDSCRLVFATGLFALIAPVAGHAAVSISSKATQNMSCSGGVCTATAASAVLNVTDLQHMLASGDLEVSTGGAPASDITVSAAITWTSAKSLTLYAYRNVAIDKPIAVAGKGGLDLESNRGSGAGYLTFGAKGDVNFFGTTNALTIDGQAFTLVQSIAALASLISSTPNGHYALANSFDASVDGTYPQSPIATTFTGTFDALGNTISRLTIDNTAASASVGLFSEIDKGGVVRHLILSKAVINGESSTYVGGIAGDNEGLLRFDSVGGKISAAAGEAGGVAGVNTGQNSGTIEFCSASASLKVLGTQSDVLAGGLVGANGLESKISDSYATGAVTVGNSNFDEAGGLVGSSFGTISTSYATGTVTGGGQAIVGGLLGYDNSNSGSIANTYWDTTTSGITDLSKGAGNIANDPGITGQTSQQLKAGLPAGFSSSVWGEKASINGGLPYLLGNPPR